MCGVLLLLARSSYSKKSLTHLSSLLAPFDESTNNLSMLQESANFSDTPGRDDVYLK